MAKTLTTTLQFAGKISASLKSAFKYMDSQASKSAIAMRKFSGNTVSFTNSLNRGVLGAAGMVAKGVAAAATVAAPAIGYLSYQSLQAASNLKEVQNVVDTTFGKSAAQINSWSKTADKNFGLSELQAKQYAGTMGSVLKSSGVTGQNMLKMSTNLAQLNGDMSSYYNLPHQEMWDKIMSGISGEIEPLRRLGINMSVANLEAFALSKGITKSYKDMSQAEQVTLRYNYLMEKSADAQGDFKKTSQSFANQQRLVQMNLNKVAVAIGNKLLPYAEKFLRWGNNMIDQVLPQIPGYVDQAAAAVSWLADGFGQAWGYLSAFGQGVASYWPIIQPFLLGIGAFVATIWLYNTAMAIATAVTGGFGAVMAFVTSPIALVALAIAALVAVGWLLYKNWDSIWDFFGEKVDWVLNKLNNLAKWFLGIGQKIGGFLNSINPFQTKKVQVAAKVSGNVPKFASGGFANSPSIFGDAGLEAAIPIKPRNPRSISLLNRTAQMLGVGSQGGINLTFAPTIYGNSTSEIKQILSDERQKFEAWAEEFFAEQGRVAYGN